MQGATWPWILLPGPSRRCKSLGGRVLRKTFQFHSRTVTSLKLRESRRFQSACCNFYNVAEKYEYKLLKPTGCTQTKCLRGNLSDLFQEEVEARCYGYVNSFQTERSLKVFSGR